jgi:DNA polymerase III delta subunit
VSATEPLVAAARAGTLAPVVLVRGDRVLAEPLALRLAAAIGEAWGVAPHRLGQPERLAEIVADLRTLALFEPGKIVVAVETDLLADKSAAAELLEQAVKPFQKDSEKRKAVFEGGPEDLHGEHRDHARKLLQVIHLYELDPAGDAERVLAKLPAAILGADAEKAARAREGLRPLLVAAVAAGLRGTGEEDVSLVGDLLRDGLPDRHLLVLVENAVAAKHPIVVALGKRKAIVEAGRITHENKEWSGIGAMTRELERETGVRIGDAAAKELARRTLHAGDARRGEGGLEGDSAARFVAEFRKLAGLVSKGEVDLRSVERHVEDRGQGDIWAVLDALGSGDAAEAMRQAHRFLRAADDPDRERLLLFGFLSAFARQIVAVRGVMPLVGVRGGEKSYPSFRDQLAPKLQGEIEGLAANPLAKLNPYRLHKAYLAASRFPVERLAALPARTLETERRLKGDSADPDAALAAYLVALAGEVRDAPASRAGSRAPSGGGGRS